MVGMLNMVCVSNIQTACPMVNVRFHAVSLDKVSEKQWSIALKRNQLEMYVTVNFTST